jgi:endo-1,4-beta-D-glucanase Y
MNARSVCALPALLLLLCCAAAPVRADWDAWSQFQHDFVQADGRVIDVTFEGKSTSEGQAYGLFFALVANQRAQFDTILKWTSANLAGNGLGERLPGWYWGKRDDGSWGIKDQNPASDADLWIAYTLLEAGRLWQAPAYDRLGRKLLALIAAQEVVDAGSAGTLLLPAPVGFKLSGDRYRLVTSYSPPFIFRYLAGADPGGPWAKAWNSFLPLALQACAQGVAPDAFVVNGSGKVLPDSEQKPVGSYDAIRVYTWTAMAGADGAELLRKLAPYAALIQQQGNPPEKVDPLTGKPLPSEYSPLGYSGALLPYLKVLGQDDLLDAQRRRLTLARMRAKLGLGARTNYYDSALILFGQGWDEGRFRFDATGRLQPQW